MYLKRSLVSSFRAFSSVCVAILFLVSTSCEEKEEHVRTPTFLISCSEQNTSLQAGQQNVQNLCVKVLDADSVPMSGVKVYFSKVQGSATFSDSVAISDTDGIAFAQMTPGTQSGDIVVKAQAEKILKSPVHFSFRISSAAPAKIEIQSGNFQEALQNVRLPNSIFLKVTDEFGNAVSNVEVSFAIKSGNGKLSWASATTLNGITTFQFTTGNGVPVTTIAASVNDHITTEITVYTLLPVQISAVNENGKIHLSWSKSTSPNFKRYVVYGGRSYYGEPMILETTDINTTSFDHVNMPVGFTYSYYVKVETRLGEQVDSQRKTAESGNLVKLPYTYDIDICHDAQNGIFYIPLVYENKILMVSPDPFGKTDSIMLSQRPYRIALSPDASTLYVAYSGQSTFDMFNLASKSIVRTVDVSSALNNGAIMDIYATTNGQLFVSGNRIVKVDAANGYSLQVVANNLSFFGDRPRFLADDGTYMYVEVSSHTPNSLFKVDISQSNAPIVLEDDHGTVSGTANAVLNPDGTKLYMNNGSILLTSNFTRAAELPETTLAVALSADGGKLYTSTRWLYGVGSLNILGATSFTTEKKWEVGFLGPRIFQHGNALYILAEVELPGDAWRFYKVDLTD